MKIVGSSFLLAALSAVAAENGFEYPVGLTNCGMSAWYQKPPTRAITMNQGTTEVMLALGLNASMVGTAYLDDEIWPQLKEAYNTVPVLSAGYPHVDQVDQLDPDFMYASYSSAFATSSINYTKVLDANCSLGIERKDGTFRYHCRQELQTIGINTYLQTPYCELAQFRTKASLQELREEIWQIAIIFGVLDKGRALIDSIDEHFKNALAVTEAANVKEDPITVLWLDGLNATGESPFVGSCCGSVQTILDHAGAKNIFEDLGIADSKSWDTVTWTQVAARDPDFIVLVDAAWDTAGEKLKHICGHPIASKLRAVRNRAFLVVPFSGSTLGVRIGALAYNLAEAFVALARGQPLPAVDFSSVTIPSANGGGSMATALSGLKVFDTLPTYQTTNLETMCPGSALNLQYADQVVTPQTNASGEVVRFPSWAIAVIVTLGVLVSVAGVGFAVMVKHEKSGNPIFTPVGQQETGVEMPNANA